MTGWDALRVNRFVWSGKLFKGSKWEISVLWIADLDDPLSSKWSWKLILWKKLYKGISLDWDYTFTWTGKNILRFGFWYKGQIWKWVYKIELFPLNTNWSPIAIKLFTWSKLRKGCKFSSVLMVDFGKNSYYSESDLTQMVEDIAKNFAVFFHMRLWWKFDWKMWWLWDSQNLLFWLRTYIN